MFPHTTSGVPPDSRFPGIVLQALLNDPTLAVAVGDADGTVTLMSPALETLVRSEFAPVRAEQIPEHFGVYTEDTSRLLTTAEEPLNRARGGESFQGAVMSIRTENDHFLHLRCSGAPLRGDDGEILGGIVIFDDITVERALLSNQAALRDRLVETVNHQLRTPLTSLLGHAELLEDLLPDLPEQAARSLAAVIRSGRHLEDLVRSVSDLVDLDAARTIKCGPVQVGSLVSGCIDRSARLAEAHGVGINLSACEDVTAELDGTKFASAVRALLTNAVEFSPAGSQVEVRLTAPVGQVRVEVADAGPGIAPSERQRVLLPFDRGDSSLTDPTGRGLGLAVAHAVTVAHRGRLELEDNNPTGLRVRVEVPQFCGQTGDSVLAGEACFSPLDESRGASPH